MFSANIPRFQTLLWILRPNLDKSPQQDSAHQDLSNGVNIRSVAQLGTELLRSKPGSTTNFIPNYNSFSTPAGPLIDIWVPRFRRHKSMS